MIKGASSVLEELGLVLQRYESLGIEPLTIGSKVEKSRRRVHWDQVAIRDFRSRAISNVTILDAFNSSLTSKTSQRMVDSIAILDERVGDLQLSKNQRERQDILEWISPLNFPAQQSAIFNRRQEGTGQWLFESPEFKKWMSNTGQTLLCRGIPGAGKTMLASITVDHLQRAFHQKTVPVTYIYCDYKRQDEQTPANLIASILKQLLQHCDSIPESVRRSHRHHVNSVTRPALSEVHDMLTNEFAYFSQIYIVVDALDELTASGQVRQILLATLRSLQKAGNVHLIMTSRFIPPEFHQFQDFMLLEICASDDDVRRYVYGHMGDLAMSVQGNPKLQETIVKSIVDAVDGMFLLAQLHVESLSDKTTPKAIKKALEMLPTGSDALVIAYSQAMQRVESQKPGFKLLAKRALSWVVYACRLLTVSELCHALAIEDGASAFDEENIDNIEEIVSVCCGLVTFDPETTAVRLVHYTTQEYFKKTGSEHFPNAKDDIAASCLTYLLYDAFGTGWTRGKVDPDPKLKKSLRPIKARLVKYPFLRYSSRFWARHAEDHSISSEHRVSKLLAVFFADDCKVSSAAQALFNLNGEILLRFGDECPSPTPISGLHLAALFNLSKTVSDMLETGRFAADAEDQRGRTPLVYAAYKNNKATVKALVHHPDVDVNRLNSTNSPWSILMSAVQRGHSEIVELLLEREEIDVNGRSHMSPLMLAAQIGDCATLEVLLRHKDIEVDYSGLLGMTALHWATSFDQIEIVRVLLLRDDVNPNQRKRNGVTSLAIAAALGRIEIAKLLLERQDVDVNSKDNNGKTVLQYAQREPMKELIRTAIQKRYGTNDEQASEQE